MGTEKRRETTREPEPPPRAAAVIGANVRRLREAAGVRQDDVAAAARRWGIEWARSSVTTLERGERELSLEELSLLPMILARACNRPAAYPWTALLPDDARVELSPRCITTGRGLRQMLGRGSAGDGALPYEVVRSVAEREADAADAALFAELAHRYGLDAELVATEALYAAEQVLEQRAAERLDAPALEVSCAAFGRWGRSLTEQRDSEVGVDYETERAQRSARGHVTRRLLDELADYITTKQSAKPTTARRSVKKRG